MMDNTAANNTATATRLVKVTEGEANGYDDSDGFTIYVDLDQKQVVTDFWTTRGYCNTPARKYKNYSECTPEEQAEAAAIAIAHLTENIKDLNMGYALDDWTPSGSYKGLKCVVKGGRKFQGEGELVEVICHSFNTGWTKVYSNDVVIKTADGEEHIAKARWATIYPDIKEVIKNHWQTMLYENGFLQLPVSYSRHRTVLDFALEDSAKHCSACC